MKKLQLRRNRTSTYLFKVDQTVLENKFTIHGYNRISYLFALLERQLL
jgi:hypothetical protein